MIENIVYPAVDEYLQSLAGMDDPVLQEMERVAAASSFPIIGPQVGRLCYQLARSNSARSVFEMGSGYGYSTWWFASAVGPQGKVVHTDGSRERSAQAKSYLSTAKLSDRVDFQVGEACALLRRQGGVYDVVFIDIDKEAYPEALALARTHVRVGGWIITDNVLWSGRVVSGPVDADVEAIRRYTREALSAPDLVTTILPVRDGVAVSLKIEPGSRP